MEISQGKYKNNEKKILLLVLLVFSEFVISKKIESEDLKKKVKLYLGQYPNCFERGKYKVKDYYIPRWTERSADFLKFHWGREARPPNYIPGVDFLNHDLL